LAAILVAGAFGRHARLLAHIREHSHVAWF
jgi:hypothetical protein